MTIKTIIFACIAASAVAAAASNASVKAQCKAMCKEVDLTHGKEEYDEKMNSARRDCKKYMKISRLFGEACTTNYGVVGEEACEHGCITGETSIKRLKNALHAVFLKKACNKYKRGQDMKNTLKACLTAADGGAVFYAKKGAEFRKHLDDTGAEL